MTRPRLGTRWAATRASAWMARLRAWLRHPPRLWLTPWRAFTLNLARAASRPR